MRYPTSSRLCNSLARLFQNRKVAIVLWFGLSSFTILQHFISGRLNNFMVFRGVYQHLVTQQNLYLFYPLQYDDVNLYGPVFGIVMIPFYYLPLKVGMALWVLFNVSILFWAICRLPVTQSCKTLTLILCSHELMNTSSWLQSNALICACVVAAFGYVKENRDDRATFFILLSGFIKIYGFIGVVFILFSQKKMKFLLFSVIWAICFFLLPLLITSFPFLIQCYKDWQEALKVKSVKNIRLDINNFYQDISVQGIIRRLFYPFLDDKIILVPAVVLYFSQLFRTRWHSNNAYQFYILCSSLIFVVIFSSGAESPTYIIAVPGMVIWFLLQPHSKWLLILFTVGLFFTTFCYSDLLTPWFREHVVRRYSLKVIPAAITWITILVQIHRLQFLQAGAGHLGNSNLNQNGKTAIG